MESGSLFHSLIQIQVSLTIQRSASVVALSNEDFRLFNNSGGGYCFRETVLNSIQMLNVRKCVCVPEFEFECAMAANQNLLNSC